MSNAFTSENRAWREKLSALCQRISDADIGRAAGGPGWTVGGLLGHLAFWDERALVLLDKWKHTEMGPSPNDIDVLNDSLRPFLNALSPAVTRRLAVEKALAIDTAIDSLEADYLARVESLGKPVRLDRAAHRKHHMEQIEKALG